MKYKTVITKIFLFLAAIAILMTGSLVAYYQLSHPRSTTTRMQTDVKTKDITITSEQDNSTPATSKPQNTSPANDSGLSSEDPEF